MSVSHSPSTRRTARVPAERLRAQRDHPCRHEGAARPDHPCRRFPPFALSRASALFRRTSCHALLLALFSFLSLFVLFLFSFCSLFRCFPFSFSFFPIFPLPPFPIFLFFSSFLCFLPHFLFVSLSSSPVSGTPAVSLAATCIARTPSERCSSTCPPVYSSHTPRRHRDCQRLRPCARRGRGLLDRRRAGRREARPQRGGVHQEIQPVRRRRVQVRAKRCLVE